MAALGAKHELTQQIFTKTMSIQVWKPEYERAGRHFVYTGRYVTFFVRLLAQLNDRPNLEALAKRIRKRSVDFVQHSVIWQEVCVAYSKVALSQLQILVRNSLTSDFSFCGVIVLSPRGMRTRSSNLYLMMIS